VQGDEPLIDPQTIDAAIAAFDADPALQMSTLRRRLESSDEFVSPHVTKVVVDCDGYALYFSRAPIPCDRDAPGRVPRSAYKHIGLYVYRREVLLALAALPPTPLERLERLEQLRALEQGYRIKTIETAYDSVGVDTAEDLERVRERFGDLVNW
jgi:3-deoxy-manno-octulosonate cytidylyltransferase (CMP-KDO synthetase)